MDARMYLYEKMREAHAQDLLREAEKEHLLAQLPKQPGPGRHIAAQLGIVLLRLGTWLKQLEQPSRMLKDPQ